MQMKRKVDDEDLEEWSTVQHSITSCVFEFFTHFHHVSTFLILQLFCTFVYLRFYSYFCFYFLFLFLFLFLFIFTYLIQFDLLGLAMDRVKCHSKQGLWVRLSRRWKLCQMVRTYVHSYIHLLLLEICQTIIWI